MHLIPCPICNKPKKIKILKSDDHEKPCRSCAQKGKKKTDEHKAKLAISVGVANTEELRTKKSQFMKDHPELWMGKIRGKDSTHQHSEETKRKIGESVKNTVVERNKENKNES